MANCYTENFNQLYRLSFVVDVSTKTMYQRVAIYVGRVLMAQEVTPERQKNDPDMPLGPQIEWVKRLHDHKPRMINLILAVTDREWDLIRKSMLYYAEQSKGSPKWQETRINYVYAIDNLRAFQD